MIDPLLGQELGGYKITRLLQRTGMSIVYLARDEKLQRDVVVKIMLPSNSDDTTFAARFQQEALATARLAHPNIVHIYDFGQRADLSYMVMEYLPGGSLYDRLAAAAQQGKRIDTATGVAIIQHMALALDHAHQAGIIHRDVKPGNILFASGGRPVLTDLGIAKAQQGPQLTKLLTAVGTPEYMSPEQGRGETVDGRSDLYSLGVVLYEILAGALPFHADTAWGFIYQHMNDAPPPIEARNPAVSPALRSIVLKALAKEPAGRFQTGQELADALRRGLESPARPLYATPPPVSMPRGQTPRPPGSTPRPGAVPPQQTPTRVVESVAIPPGNSSGPSQGAGRAATRNAWLPAAAAGVLVLGIVALLALRRPGAAAPTLAAATPLHPPAPPTATLEPPLPRATSTVADIAPAPAVTTAPTTALPPIATLLAAQPPVPDTPQLTAVVTPEPSATATPRPAPTLVSRPTATATVRPTRTHTATAANPTAALGAPILLEPAAGAGVSGQTTFSWHWDGLPLAASQGFEVRIWREGQTDHFGAANPVTGTSITFDVSSAYGVQKGGSGSYLWTVAVVQRDPYIRTGSEAAPRPLQVSVAGGGAPPTSEIPPP